MRLKGKRIYIAEDDTIVREAVATILEEEGATVIQSEDGEKIFTSVTFGKPDCIIMDLYMPISDGFASIEAITSLLPIDCPILVLTGHATSENISRAKQLGAAQCLAKPVKAGELIETVSSLMGV